MRRLIALLIGVALAVIGGYLYMKFSGPLVSLDGSVSAGKPAATSTGRYALLFLAILFSWATAFIPMPAWLAVVIDLAIFWFGLAVFSVAGFFVYMTQPSNTLQDPTYVAFLCSIAMIAPRLLRILRLIARGDIQ